MRLGVVNSALAVGRRCNARTVLKIEGRTGLIRRVKKPMAAWMELCG